MKKRLLLLQVLMLLAVVLTPQVAWAETYYYKKADGSIASTSDANVVEASTNALSSGVWVVAGTVKANERIYVNTNDVTLILLDGAKLDATSGGIGVAEGGTFTITIGNETQDIAGTGALTATGGEYQAGIGGSGNAGSNGTINILGGDVTATSSSYASGIGCGNGGDGGIVNISGGTVKAYGNYYMPAIGGRGANPGTLTISGTADVIVQSKKNGCYVLICSQATATPDEGYLVYVQDADENDIYNETVTTPSTSQVDLVALGLTSSHQYAHIFFSDGKVTLAEVEKKGVDGTEYTLRDTLLVVKVLDNDGGVVVRDYATSFMANDIEDGQIDYVKDVKLQTTEWLQNNWIVLTGANYVGNLAEGTRITGVKGTYNKDDMTLEVTSDVTTAGTDEVVLNNYVAANFEGTQKSDVTKVTYYFVDPKPCEVAQLHWMMWDGIQFVVPSGETDSQGKPINGADLGGLVSVNWSLMGGKPEGLTSGSAYNFTALVKMRAVEYAAPRRIAPEGNEYVIYPLNLSPNDNVTTLTENMLNKEISHIDYVNTIGQVSATPWEGLNIVMTHYSDGSTSTVKVVK